MKNELIDLLNDSFEKQYEKRGLLTAHHTAEDLIANGVTIQKWIPTKERFPAEEDVGENKYVIVHEVSGRVRPVYFKVVRWHPEEFTHWMLLPSADGLG